MSSAASLRERLLALAAFVPEFESPGFVFGTWVPSRKTGENTWTMPYVDFSERARAFLRAAGGWVTPKVDWMAWAQTPEASEFMSRPESIARATPDDLTRLLTMLVRGDRFGEGTLQSAFESGVLTAIVRRAAVLAESGAIP